MTESYSYDIFGLITSSFSSVGNPYYFTGRRYDSETGLYYYRARMYSSSTGRFHQVDPVGYYGDMNLYRYCSNNPTTFIDPFGYIDIYINRGSENRGSIEGDVGHVSIGFDNNPNDTYGFYPKESVEANVRDLIRNHPGVVKHSDPMTKDPKYYDEKITIPTTPEQDQKIRDYCEKKKNNPDPWNLPLYNCTDFIGEALEAGGVKVDTGKPISSPRELSDNLKTYKGKPRKK